MQTFELLDRFELLYPTNTNLADLRRAYTDKDLSSVFRLLKADDDLRRAVMEENLHSIFRIVKNYDVEELRKAVIEKNLHSLFRLAQDEDLRKLVLEDNTWKLWPVLERYTDTQFVTAFKSFYVNNIDIDKDCFSKGQLQSKLWLIHELKKTKAELGTVYLCAGWYATLATMLFESNMKVEKIRSFDLDPSCATIAETFNKRWLMDDWRFKASTVDIMDFKFTTEKGAFYYNTKIKDRLIESNDTPNTIINTSCEHIPDFETWYDKIPDSKLVVLQSNDYVDVEEHVNIHTSLESFVLQTPMKTELFSGELKLPKYTRYMRIGFK